jgi:hypothetical protein
MSKIALTKNGSVLYLNTVTNKLYANNDITNINSVWYPINTPSGTLKSVNMDEHRFYIGLVVDTTLYTASWNNYNWVNRGSGIIDVAMINDGRWYQIETGGKLVFKDSSKKINITTPGPVSHISAGGNWWTGRITILVNGQDYNTDWDYKNTNPIWIKGLPGRPNTKVWVSTANRYWYLVIHTTTFEFIDRTNYISLPLPPNTTITQFELNHVGLVVALDKSGYIWWSSSDLYKTPEYTWTISTNKLPNPRYPGTYYGNTLQSPKYKTITLTKGNTDGIPVLNWRRNIEWHYNSCGYSSGCDSFNRSIFPFSDAGMCIEAPATQTNWVQKKGQGNCIAGQAEAWCFVPSDFLTHVFGDIAGTDTIPAYGKQYTELSKPNAWDLQITPFDKVMNTSDGTMNTFNADYRDVRWMDNNKKPTFASLKFNLPDPIQQIDIDTTIPLILINYHKKGWLELSQLNDYLGKYLFTDVNKIPRISIKTGTLLPSNIADIWKTISGNSFSLSSHNYCKLTNLTGDYCKTFCKLSDSNCDTNLLEFCGTPGKGKLPSYTHNGILPKTKVTQKMLDDAYPNYSLFTDVCGCNMPKEYYKQLNISVYQNMKDGEKLYSKLFSQGGLGGRPLCDPLTQCRDGTALPNKADIALGKCPDIAIQNCIQENIIKIGGPVSGLNAQNTQSMNCIQDINDSTKNTNNNTINSKDKDKDSISVIENIKSSMTPEVIAVVVAITVAIIGIIFGFYKFLTR